MTTTESTTRMLNAFVAFVETVRNEYADRAIAALTAAQDGQYDDGRALLAEFDDLTSLVASFAEGFVDTNDRAEQIRANDAASNMMSALVPTFSELCAALDDHDPVTIERSHRALIEHFGEELFREMQAAGEV